MSGPSKRERLKLPRTDMPTQHPAERRWNFDEVNSGYTPEQAVVEANRCLLCANPPCVAGCPVGIEINEFVRLVQEEQFAEAAGVIARDSSLPAVCGRVCPQEDQCEGACVLAKKGKPIAIGHLERFVADFAREHGREPTHEDVPRTGK